MIFFRNHTNNVLEAISNSMAVIEFDPTGKVLSANKNFCQLLQYEEKDLVGQHHSIFCDPTYVSTEAYKSFWKKLASGEFVAGDFLRRKKDQTPVWIQATYSPVLDNSGKVKSIVKLATDISSKVASTDRIRQVLQKVSELDLTEVINSPLPGVYEGVGTMINAAMDRLKEIVAEVVSISQIITEDSGSLQIAISRSSEQVQHQAVATEKTTVALNDLTVAVKQTATEGEEAKALVSKVLNVTSASEGVMSSALSTMSKIEESATGVGKIVGLIDDIAFQTNLLALNAGVEAARAGETGRGFAVVASEVRALAQRSAAAAKEIKQLISRSSEEVTQGVELVEQANKALMEIATEVRSVQNLIAKISTLNSSQATSLAEIDVAMKNINQSTQQSASVQEEIGASAAEMNAEARRLTSIARRFKVASTDRGEAHAFEKPALIAPKAASAAAPASANAAKLAPVKQQQQMLSKAIKDFPTSRPAPKPANSLVDAQARPKMPNAEMAPRVPVAKIQPAPVPKVAPARMPQQAVVNAPKSVSMAAPTSREDDWEEF